MRNIYLITLLVIPTLVFSQTSIGNLGFNYSALVRDTAGRVQPLKPVKLKFTLLAGQNGSTESSPWIETHNVTTDAYGFVNITIGTGAKESGTAGSFADIDFTVTNYWILIEVLNSFTGAYDPLAKQAFQSVPYAKVAGALAGSSALPPGSIVAFGGDTANIPKGWLLCDGRELDNSDTRYVNLFNAIKYNWGTSNNANKFNIPDTRGLFLRGVDNGSGNDPDAASRTYSGINGNAGDKAGSKQADELKSHTHVFDAIRWNSNNGNMGYGNYPASHLGGTTQAAGGNETRPKNVYVNYIIKL